jgi:hypothetical protein
MHFVGSCYSLQREEFFVLITVVLFTDTTMLYLLFYCSSKLKRETIGAST